MDQRPNPVRRQRCAIYTRKSSEEGLEQEFNSLHAQREACEAFIASQRSEGWVLVRDQYDDGGISGGTLERPGLKQLLADIEDGLIDVVVVYKIDRLSRSLMDFSKLVEVFDRNGVTFVSVTQSFNTTTSMGRLTLNILLSFAQFEREVTAERIRDKVRASRMKGMWMGGYVPLGYDVMDRKLVVNEDEAATVRGIFERFVEVGSATVLARELRRKGVRNKQGTLVDKGYLYRVLVNRVYRGDAVHKGKAYPGEHQAIIDEQLWDQVHAILRQNPRKRANNTRAQAPALLKGLIFTATGAAMTPSSTKKGARRYRYYVSMDVIKNREPSDAGIPRRLPADLVEAAVVTELRRVMRAPSITAQVIAHLAREGHAFAEADVISALQTFEDVWAQLFPAEQTRIVQLLVRRVTGDVRGAGHRCPDRWRLGRHARHDGATKEGGGGMMKPDESIQIFVPLKVRKQNGRPKIMPPSTYLPSEDRTQDPHILRAVGRAWGWRRRMEAGEFNTVTDLAKAVGLAERHVSRQLRLAYLAPGVLKRLVYKREVPAVTLLKLTDVAALPWHEQPGQVFD